MRILAARHHSDEAAGAQSDPAGEAHESVPSVCHETTLRRRQYHIRNGNAPGTGPSDGFLSRSQGKDRTGSRRGTRRDIEINERDDTDRRSEVFICIPHGAGALLSLRGRILNFL